MRQRIRWEVSSLVTSSLRARAYLQDNFSLIHGSLEDNKLYNYPKGGRKGSHDKSLFFLMSFINGIIATTPCMCFRMHVRVIDKCHDSMSHLVKTVDGQTKISISLLFSEFVATMTRTAQYRCFNHKNGAITWSRAALLVTRADSFACG